MRKLLLFAALSLGLCHCTTPADKNKDKDADKENFFNKKDKDRDKEEDVINKDKYVVDKDKNLDNEDNDRDDRGSSGWSSSDKSKLKEKFGTDLSDEQETAYQCVLEAAQKLFKNFDELAAVENKSANDRSAKEEDKYNEMEKAVNDCGGH